MNATSSRARVGKHSSDMFPNRNVYKQVNALTALLFNVASEYAFRRVQVNQEGLILNGAHQFLVYAYNDNISGGSLHTIKKNAQSLVVVSKESRIKVNADKIKYMVMSRDQTGCRSHNMTIDDSSFERVEVFKCLGKTYHIKILIRKN